TVASSTSTRRMAWSVGTARSAPSFSLRTTSPPAATFRGFRKQSRSRATTCDSPFAGGATTSSPRSFTASRRIAFASPISAPFFPTLRTSFSSSPAAPFANRTDKMLRGLWKLTWIELKVFLREPLGAFGTIGVPVLVFVVLGRVASPRFGASPAVGGLQPSTVPVLVALLIAISAVLSLVTIISIYREGGILKRLRATPLRPQTILTAHVVVKLILTAVTLALMVLAGKRYYPVAVHVPLFSFTIALLISTWSILSIGFLIASIIPTARFAQPIGAIIMYPMIAVSGLFVPVESLPAAAQVVARVVPLTYAVSLLAGIWKGDTWWAHTR